MHTSVLENEYGKSWVEDGILFFVYKEGVTIDLAAAKKIIEERIAFQREVAYPLLTDITGVRHFEQPARNFFATEGTKLIKCVAVIANSLSSKLKGEFYASVNKPLVPTRVFVDRDSALEYLKEFR
jgi:hypothetical protein